MMNDLICLVIPNPTIRKTFIIIDMTLKSE